MHNIVRFGVSIDDKLLSRFDTIIETKGYVNRSEAIRDLIRNTLVSEDISNPDTEVIGTLTLIYSHDEHEVSDRLNEIQHGYYKNVISSTHVHLDEHNCLEVLILRGRVQEVQFISDNLQSVKNVRHGRLTVTSTGKNLP
ncbi:MAG TPA: nickel-responsive transcriptional regulator NikR [Spirochaetota bacterium]|nr:nickel-responsive transcriptional regulator NikR [Spirochaetota bacterium]HPJ37715.1 nickel-responsive transcriptional regulator NikR [Spirochaetota bacterium]HPQ53461.1 nickel-responsive transcriptional regulator NikR [Spirochaetota bacterium]